MKRFVSTLLVILVLGTLGATAAFASEKIQFSAEYDNVKLDVQATGTDWILEFEGENSQLLYLQNTGDIQTRHLSIQNLPNTMALGYEEKLGNGEYVITTSGDCNAVVYIPEQDGIHHFRVSIRDNIENCRNATVDLNGGTFVVNAGNITLKLTPIG